MATNHNSVPQHPVSSEPPVPHSSSLSTAAPTTAAASTIIAAKATTTTLSSSSSSSSTSSATTATSSVLTAPVRTSGLLQGLLASHSNTFLGDSHLAPRVDVARLKANDPIEDRMSLCMLSDNKVLFAGVFDGHGGWECAHAVSRFLPSYVAVALAKVGDKASEEAVGTAISDAFVQLDRDLCHDVAQRAAIREDATGKTFLNAACAGACACAAVITRETIYVANTGDCRAVLGARLCRKAENTTGSSSSSSSSSSNGVEEWRAIPMSEDQSVTNASEMERIRQEHPGEECLRSGRLLGSLIPSRVFGDGRFKWSKDESQFLGDEVSSVTLTPPYLTAQPDVWAQTRDRPDAHTRVQRFIIVATDGIWATLSSKDAVRIVGNHLDSLQAGISAASALITAAVESCARETGYDIDQLLEMKKPRQMRDDMSAIVVMLDPSYTKGVPRGDPIPQVEITTLMDKFEEATGSTLGAASRASGAARGKKEKR